MKYALEHDMIDMQYIQAQAEMIKRKELLEKHQYKIWQGKDGKWRTYIPDDENGRKMIKRNTEESVEQAVIDYWTEKLENPTIREVFDEWNDRRTDLKKISPATQMRNRQVFNRHFKEFGIKRIKNITPLEMEEFLEEQIPKFDLTAKAFSNLKTIVRGFLKRAKKRNLITFNVEEVFQELDTSDTDFKRVIKEDYEEVFSEDEMPIIIEYLENNLDIRNLGILLMFVTGLRVGELATLRNSDFLSTGVFHVRRTETRYIDKDGKYVWGVKEFPKTKAGVRTVVVPKDYEWVVRKILHIRNMTDDEYVFMENGRRLTTQNIRMRLKRVCKKIGIYHKSPHKIRKTYGSILLDNNIDQRFIIGQMGHTDITCTERSYHRNRRTIDRKAAIISEIPEFKGDLITK